MKTQNDNELKTESEGKRAMTDRYERIRKALAMGPTPGPWEWKEGQSIITMKWDGKEWSIASVEWSSPGGHENGRCEILEAGVNTAHIAACDPGTIRELLTERDGLAAENARLREALHVVSECGDPCKVILYDEEGIEGWRWTHPDGREWTETGEWGEDPPLHPVARAALTQEKGRHYE